jgi:hypothetical protein
MVLIRHVCFAWILQATFILPTHPLRQPEYSAVP